MSQQRKADSFWICIHSYINRSAGLGRATDIMTDEWATRMRHRSCAWAGPGNKLNRHSLSIVECFLAWYYTNFSSRASSLVHGLANWLAGCDALSLLKQTDRQVDTARRSIFEQADRVHSLQNFRYVSDQASTIPSLMLLNLAVWCCDERPPIDEMHAQRT